MSALFGFIGPPDDDLMLRLKSALQHRGSGLATHVCGQGSIAVLGGPEQDTGGIHSEGGLSIALCGRLAWPPPSPDRLAKLLRRYAEGGIDFVRTLSGSFTMAILDGEMLYLVRDSGGRASLSYARIDGRLIFASEPRALLEAGAPNRICLEGVYSYFCWGLSPSGSSLRRDVRSLPSGSFLVQRGMHDPRTERYFSPQSDEPFPIAAGCDWPGVFESLLRSSLKECWPAQGGASLVMEGRASVRAFMEVASELGLPLRLHALAPAWDWQRELAEQLGLELSEAVVPSPSLPGLLKSAVQAADAPLVSPGILPKWAILRQSGPGGVWLDPAGDALLGHRRQLSVLLSHWYAADGRKNHLRARQVLAARRGAYKSSSQLFTSDFLEAVDEEKLLLGPLSELMEGREPRLLIHKCIAAEALWDLGPRLEVRQRLFGSQSSRIAAPLADERLLRLVFSMPGECKIRGGQTQPLLHPRRRRTAVPYTQDQLWLDSEVQDYARELLLGASVRDAGIFRQEYLASLLDLPREVRNHKKERLLWLVLNFEVWRRA